MRVTFKKAKRRLSTWGIPPENQDQHGQFEENLEEKQIPV